MKHVYAMKRTDGAVKVGISDAPKRRAVHVKTEFKHEFKDYPFDGKYHLCTIEKPAPNGAPGLWEHRDSASTGVCSEGCCDIYTCPACGRSWTYAKVD